MPEIAPAGTSGVPRPDLGSTLDSLVWRRAAATPAATAIRDGSREVTYSELIRLATVQADRLRRAGLGAGDRILIDLPRSAAEIVAVLGIIRIGASYVAVEPASSPGQRAAVVAASAARGAIGETALPGCDTPVVTPVHPGGADATVPQVDPLPPDGARPAYVAFTSGSTGTPKGVVVPHRAVVRLALEPSFIRHGPAATMLRFAPLSFDASTLEIWVPLINGGTVAIHPPGVPSPVDFGRALSDLRVDVAWLTAGLFETFAQIQPEVFGGLRQLLTGGDVVSPSAVRAVLRSCPGLRISNGYGPTENTTFTTVHHVDSVAEVTDPLPIGRPIAGTSVHVLDERGEPVPPGTVGELWASGSGLALGYLNGDDDHAFPVLSGTGERAHRTGDQVRYDDDGQLVFVGRTDAQVKIRGYRVDLADVRARIEAHADVAAAVTFTEGSGSGGRRLAVAVRLLRPGTLATVRADLGGEMPAHLVPSVWREVEQFPVTATGKIDYRQLATPSPEERSPTGDTVAGPLAAALFTEALGRDAGEDDDFFMLGGDSLAAVRMIGELRRRHGVEVPMREFFQRPTRRRLADLVTAARRGTA